MIKNKSLKLYEQLAHEAAMDAAERRELTPSQRDISRRMHELAHARLQEIERADAKATKVRATIRAMDRPSMLQRLSEIFSTRPGSVLAFRNFERLSDDDLRSALEDAESMLERMV